MWHTRRGAARPPLFVLITAAPSVAADAPGDTTEDSGESAEQEADPQQHQTGDRPLPLCGLEVLDTLPLLVLPGPLVPFEQQRERHDDIDEWDETEQR